MNITQLKRQFRENLSELEAELSRVEGILAKIEENPDDDYLVQYALEKGTKASIDGCKEQIKSTKFYLINAKITHLFIIFNKADIHNRRLYTLYTPQFLSTLANLKKELESLYN